MALIGLRLARPKRKHAWDRRRVARRLRRAERSASPMISIAMLAVWSSSVAVILVMPGATGDTFHPPSTFSILATSDFGSVTLTFGSLLTSSNPPFSYWRSSLAVCGMAWTPADRKAARTTRATTLPAGLISPTTVAAADDRRRPCHDHRRRATVATMSTPPTRRSRRPRLGDVQDGLGLLSAEIGDDLGLSGAGALHGRAGSHAGDRRDR